MNLLLLIGGLTLLTCLLALFVVVTVKIKRQHRNAPTPHTDAYLADYKAQRKQAKIDDLQESREYWNEKWAGHR